MKFSFVKSTAFALALLSQQAAASDNSINLRGAVSAAVGDSEDKKTAAEKRQEQRDRRRSIDNPNRSQQEEDRETARKERQSRNSGRDNPKSSRSFQESRSRRSQRNCEDYGEDCNYTPRTDDYYDDFVAFGKAYEDAMVADSEDRKKDASEKRQDQRDSKRSIDNPYRSQHEEDRETARKEEQQRNSGRKNPKESRSYQESRNRKGQRNCEDYGEDCDYEARTAGRTDDDVIAQE